MTNPTPHGQVPEALRLAEEITNLECSSEAAAKTIAAAADELCRLHVENASLRASPAASPAPPAEQQAAPKAAAVVWLSGKQLRGITALHGQYLPFRLQPEGRFDTPVYLEEAAPKAAPGVGNSGFDHQTAADFLSGKTVSDEAVRKFVVASRWAHDERAALSATLLAMHGVLTSREAEIAHLKKALLEAEAAPQPAPLSDDVVKDAARWRMVALICNEVMLHPDKRTHATAVKAYMDATHSGLDLTGAVDAALAAQGGKT